MLNQKVVKCIDLACADSIGQTTEYYYFPEDGNLRGGGDN